MPTSWKVCVIDRSSDLPFHGLPAKPGVYVIYSGKRIVYIGSSKNINNRLKDHVYQKDRGNAHYARASRDISTLDVMVVKYKLSKKHGDWLMFEARLINRLRPPWNYCPGRPKSTPGRSDCDKPRWTGKVGTTSVDVNYPVPIGGYKPRGPDKLLRGRQKCLTNTTTI